jgi:YVTN family beta-propeller protein
MKRKRFMTFRLPSRLCRRLVHEAAAVALVLASSCGDPLDPGPEGSPTPSVLTGSFSEEVSAASRSSLESVRSLPMVSLSWTECPDDDFFSYVLSRSSVRAQDGEQAPGSGILVTTDRTCTDFDDYGVQWGKTYTYSLLTLDTEELGAWSNTIGITIPGSAPTPSLLSVDSVMLDQAGLVWTESQETDFHHYSLFRSTSPGIALEPDSAVNLENFYNRESCSWVDEDLEFGTDYYYCLSTTNALGFSSWSNEVDTVVIEPPFPWDQIEWVYCNSPREVCLLPGGEMLYVTNYENNTVSAYETAGFQRIAVIPVGDHPFGIDCSPDGEYLYVANSYEETLSFIRTSDHTVTMEAHIPNGCTLVRSFPDGDRLCILSPPRWMVYVMDIATGLLVDSLALEGDAGDMCLSQDGGLLIITNRNSGRVLFVETEGLTVEKEVPLAGLPEGLLPTEDGCLWCSAGNGTLYRIEVPSGVIQESYGTGVHGYSLGLLPGGDYLYIADTSVDAAGVIDPSSGEVCALIGMGAPTVVSCMPGGDRVLFLSYAEDCFRVLGFPE